MTLPVSLKYTPNPLSQQVCPSLPLSRFQQHQDLSAHCRTRGNTPFDSSADGIRQRTTSWETCQTDHTNTLEGTPKSSSLRTHMALLRTRPPDLHCCGTGARLYMLLGRCNTLHFVDTRCCWRQSYHRSNNNLVLSQTSFAQGPEIRLKAVRVSQIQCDVKDKDFQLATSTPDPNRPSILSDAQILTFK